LLTLPSKKFLAATMVEAADSDPVPATHLPPEVAPLIQELNRLLARVQKAFATQRAFIADAAHELRSPLTAVRLQLQLLDRASNGEARAEARAQLGAAVDRATHLIEQLLTLARAEPGEAPVKPLLLKLESIAAEAIAETHAFALARNIDLELQNDGQPQVLGDPASVRTLVRNLVDNAVRYTPEGGQVLVRTRATPSGATLDVIDNGPGIPPEERERSFDRFFRRAASPDGGSGLGLAIVKAIAEAHGARVALNDAPGGGLHVSVAFPPAP
jgi:signal transduction histidine kinase